MSASMASTAHADRSNRSIRPRDPGDGPRGDFREKMARRPVTFSINPDNEDVYGPCYYYIASAFLGSDDGIGIFTGIHSGKSPMGMLRHSIESLLEDRNDTLRRYRGYDSDDRPGRYGDHDWAALDGPGGGRLEPVEPCGKRGVFSYLREVHEDETRGRVAVLGNIAFWPSIDGAYYKRTHGEHFVKNENDADRSRPAYRDADLPVWRDYVYRGSYAAASAFARRGVRTVYVMPGIHWPPNEFSLTTCDGHDGFLMVLFAAFKDAACEHGTTFDLDFYNCGSQTIRYNWMRQRNMTFSEHRPFPMPTQTALDGLSEEIVFTEELHHDHNPLPPLPPEGGD